jgi:murein DD-endopeptidase MepM/ murein hydrolase activator NlpD
MVWKNPLPLKLIVTNDSLSFLGMPEGSTGLPILPHPGAFGFVRKHHIHEGVDLYAPEGTPVTAVEKGVVVGVMPFTGEHAGYPNWENTWCVLVEGKTGVVVYGEIDPSVHFGDEVRAGDLIGTIMRVLKNDKGRPMSMLHLELYVRGTRDVVEWTGLPQDPSHLDPTPHLRKIAE